MKHPRCKRIETEQWKAPGGQGSDWPGGTLRTMRARCVLEEDHEQYADTPRHIFGDWLEVKELGT